MRVIGGTHKGQRLDAPTGMRARPTTDRVKESMFNLMGPLWLGKVAVDLFAGSGALGIEALSRGADHAVFIDKSPKSMAVVRSNVTRVNRLLEATLLVADWRQGLARVMAKDAQIGWVFVDPPYGLDLWEEVLQMIAGGPAVVYGVVCEHPKSVTLSDSVGTLRKVKERSYGDIAVTLYADTRGTEE